MPKVSRPMEDSYKVHQAVDDACGTEENRTALWTEDRKGDMGKMEQKLKRMKPVVSLILACAVVSASMTGCRESKMIERIKYTDTATVKSDKTKINPSSAGKTDKKAPAKKETKSDASETKKKETKAVKGNADNSDQKVADSNGKGKTDSDAAGTGKGKDGKSSGGGSASAGNGKGKGNKQVYDANGKKVSVPKVVTSVAAPGQAGLIVQMLGGKVKGKSILYGSSESFLDNSLAKSVFSDEGIKDVKKLWEGEGASVMSDAEFEKLLKVKPDCCFGINGQDNFSESQIKKLKKAKIAYLPIPALTSAANIENAVEIVGEVIGDNSARGGQDASDLAGKYIQYEQDEVVSSVEAKKGLYTWNDSDYNTTSESAGYQAGHSKLSAGEGKCTVYIDGWDSDASAKLTDSGETVLDQEGMAMATPGWWTRPVSYYMSVAGVINSATQGHNWKSEKELLLSPLTEKFSKLDGTFSGNLSTSESLAYEKADMGSSGYPDWFFSVYSKDNRDAGKAIGQLGDSQFPAVVVANQEIKSELVSSRGSSTGLYRTKNLKNESTGFESSICGDYAIYVNPEGIGSWADGSVESVLESVWVSGTFYGTYSKSKVKSEIRSFYKEFYRYSLSDSQLSRILAGADS